MIVTHILISSYSLINCLYFFFLISYNTTIIFNLSGRIENFYVKGGGESSLQLVTNS